MPPTRLRCYLLLATCRPQWPVATQSGTPPSPKQRKLPPWQGSFLCVPGPELEPRSVTVVGDLCVAVPLTTFDRLGLTRLGATCPKQGASYFLLVFFVVFLVVFLDDFLAAFAMALVTSFPWIKCMSRDLPRQRFFDFTSCFFRQARAADLREFVPRDFR